MMMYTITKAMIASPDGNTDFCEIIDGDLQVDTLTPLLLRMHLDYVLQTSVDQKKENGYTLENAISRWYPEEIISDAD